MTLLPDIIPSIGDIEKLGVEYNYEASDNLPHVIYSFDLNTDKQAISIHARVTKASPDTAGQHFAYFETVSIFNNEAGVINQKGESTNVVLRGTSSPNTKVFFDIVGTTVRLNVQNTLAVHVKWVAMVAVVKI